MEGTFSLENHQYLHIWEPLLSEANQQRTVLKYFYQGVLLLISCYFHNTLFIVLMFTVWGKPARSKQIGTSFQMSSSAYLLPSP